MTNTTKMVAKDAKTGLVVREATEAEARAYHEQVLPAAYRNLVAREAFKVPVRIGDVLIDTDTGPGLWFGGAGF